MPACAGRGNVRTVPPGDRFERLFKIRREPEKRDDLGRGCRRGVGGRLPDFRQRASRRLALSDYGPSSDPPLESRRREPFTWMKYNVDGLRASRAQSASRRCSAHRRVVVPGVCREHRAVADAGELRCVRPASFDLGENSRLDVEAPGQAFDVSTTLMARAVCPHSMVLGPTSAGSQRREARYRSEPRRRFWRSDRAPECRRASGARRDLWKRGCRRVVDGRAGEAEASKVVFTASAPARLPYRFLPLPN